MAQTKIDPLRLNRVYSDEEGIAKISEFIEGQDRGQQPIFVGREEIIEQITKAVVRCRLNTRAGQCFTITITGPPGSGKTSLLEELNNRLGSKSTGGVNPNQALTVVSLEGNDLSSAVTVAGKLISGYTGEKLSVSKENTRTTSGKLGFSKLFVGRNKSSKDIPLSEQVKNAGMLWLSVIDNTDINVENDVFLLLMDEAQAIQGYATEGVNGSNQNNIVMGLHAGFKGTSGLKIVPVFAGLSDTETVLSERGVTRLGSDAVIRLGSLTQTETEELVTEWMQHESFGFNELFKESDLSRVSKIIAIASEGWPRHANICLRELGKAILDKSLKLDQEIDLNEVLEKSHDERVRHYGQRIVVARLRRFEAVLSDAAQSSTDGTVESEALTEIAENDYQMTPSEVEERIAMAVHAGILETVSEYERHRLKFPIPSLFTYMQLNGDRLKFKNKMRNQIISRAHLWGGKSASEADLGY